MPSSRRRLFRRPTTQALSALEGRIAALEASQEANAPKLSELADRVAKLDTSLKTLAKTAEEGGSVAAAAAIGQQIEEAEQRLDAKIADALAKGEAANTAAIEANRGTSSPSSGPSSGLWPRPSLEPAMPPRSQPELAALAERLAKLEAMLPELAGAIDKEAAGAKSAALAIAFANLRAAVSDGRPYAAELDTIGTLAPALGDLGVLPAYAEKGIPTLPDLARSFAAARDEALAAPAPEGDASLVDSLMASAQSLVKIRRIDEAPAGEGAEAALARAKSALDNGQPRCRGERGRNARRRSARRLLRLARRGACTSRRRRNFDPARRSPAHLHERRSRSHTALSR